MSKIYVEDISAEDLFEWFDRSINQSGGDGAAVICRENYKEVSQWFVDWWADKNGLDSDGNRVFSFHGEKHTVKYGKKRFPHERGEYDNFVNYHDSDENFMFTDKEIDLGHGDYTFVVLVDCRFKKWDSKLKDRVIKGVK